VVSQVLSLGISSIPPSCDWDHLRALTQPIAEEILLGKAIAVSGGSYKKGVGSAAWLLQGHSGKGRICNTISVPGSVDIQSSFRSKLAGKYATIFSVSRICQLHNILAGSIELGCNGVLALWAIQLDVTLNFNHSNYDLLATIKGMLLTSPILWSFHHIVEH
jgi:hypothetical protein